MEFDALYRSYARDVYRFALFLTGKPEEADDITAETFMRAWTAPEPIRVGTVKAYLFMIARNLSYAERRRHARQAELDEALPDRGRDPETTTAARDELARVTQAMQGLPEIDRAALLMRAEGELSYDEIARALGITVGAAKVKVHRARARLTAVRDARVTS